MNHPRAGDCTGFDVRHHDTRHSATIAGWVRTAEQLRWLAPGTPAPLTAAKVDTWAAEGDIPMLYWHEATHVPAAYGELNRMPGHDRWLWIGHLIVAPGYRGRGIGGRFLRQIVDRAFQWYQAERLSLVVLPVNHRAIRCYRKAGMVDDGLQTQRCAATGDRIRLLKMTLSRRRFQRDLHRRTPRRVAIRP